VSQTDEAVADARKSNILCARTMSMANTRSPQHPPGVAHRRLSRPPRRPRPSMPRPSLIDGARAELIAAHRRTTDYRKASTEPRSSVRLARSVVSGYRE
jgi:hypothetical protein